MKRIIPLLLILALILVQLPSLLAVPVKAAENIDDNNNTSINVLDYAKPNGSDDFSIYFDGTTRVNFNFGASYIFSYVDIVIAISGNRNLTSATLSHDTSGSFDYPLTVLNLGTEGSRTYYRLYGTCSTRYTKSFDLVLNTNSSARSWVFFYSFYANTAPATVYETSADVTLGTPAGNYEFSYTPGSTSAIKYITYSGSYVDSTFTMFVDFPDWKKYDYIDIQIYLEVNSLTSIGAYYGSTVIPVTVSYLGPSNTSGSGYFITLRLDLRGLDRTSDDPNIILMGQMVVFDSSFVNVFSVLACNGYILNSYGSLFPYWMSKIIDSIDDNSSGIITSLSTAFSNLFTNLNDNFSSLIANDNTLGAYLRNQIVTSFNSLIENDNLLGKYLRSSIETAYKAIISTLDKYLGSSGAGEEIANEGASIKNEFELGQAELDAVDKPSGGNITAVNSLGAVNFTANTSYLTQIVNTKYIKDVFVFVAILAVLSLVLFGTKKGG